MTKVTSTAEAYTALIGTGNSVSTHVAGTGPNYSGTVSTSTAKSSAAKPTGSEAGAATEDRLDPEIEWLTSAAAKRYEGHWVALRAGSAEVLGLADTANQLRKFADQDVSVVLVEPRGLRLGG